ADAYARLDLEDANVRAVVKWATARKRYARIAELFAVLHVVWTSRSNIGEIAGWTEEALRARASVAVELWPRVLLGVEKIRLAVGDRAQARSLLNEALDVLRQIDAQPLVEAMCLSELSWIATERAISTKRGGSPSGASSSGWSTGCSRAAR